MAMTLVALALSFQRKIGGTADGATCEFSPTVMAATPRFASRGMAARVSPGTSRCERVRRGAWPIAASCSK
eukprot:489683-Prymnesium_polylepis.1